NTSESFLPIEPHQSTSESARWWIPRAAATYYPKHSRMTREDCAMKTITFAAVGVCLVQSAHIAINCAVISTASPANHGYVRKLGADRVIDYHTEDFTKVADPCDVVFDTVGGEVQVRSYDVLKPGGRLVWIAA